MDIGKQIFGSSWDIITKTFEQITIAEEEVSKSKNPWVKKSLKPYYSPFLTKAPAWLFRRHVRTIIKRIDKLTRDHKALNEEKIRRIIGPPTDEEIIMMISNTSLVTPVTTEASTVAITLFRKIYKAEFNKEFLPEANTDQKLFRYAYKKIKDRITVKERIIATKEVLKDLKKEGKQWT